MTKTMIFAGLVCALALGGCGRLGGIGSGASGLFGGQGIRGKSQEVNGIRFRSRVTAISEDDRQIAITTNGAGRDLATAAEAGRLAAVEYCLGRFGGSEIVWTAGPDREIEAIALDESGALVLQGTCVAR